MKVKIEIEFDVEIEEGNDLEDIEAYHATAAAQEAAHQYLCFTLTGVGALDDGPVTVHVDGLGEFNVTLIEPEGL